MSTGAMAKAIPYTEPDASTLLTLASFLLLLNVIEALFDRVLSCAGLIGQILVGVAWGTPGWGVVAVATEKVLGELGYVGLVLLVFEDNSKSCGDVLVWAAPTYTDTDTSKGGLSTSFRALRANLALSTGLALTGVSLPIGLSYILLRLVPGTTALQAFAAGAALCSTSLGTTFTILSAGGLVNTRLGVVLSTAAMMDDVVGLVMVQVISNLGAAGQSDFSAVTVIRPVFVSLAFAVVVPLIAWLFVRPCKSWLDRKRQQWRNINLERTLNAEEFAVTLHTTVLVGMVAGSSYAGTSNLFAAYLAGAAISWWDSELPHPVVDTVTDSREDGGAQDRRASKNLPGDLSVVDQTPMRQKDVTNGNYIFATYYQHALKRILRPFFFASIGFSIPIAAMFAGNIVWRGIVYSMLMFVGKFACGLWLTRWPGTSLLSFRTMDVIASLKSKRAAQATGESKPNSRRQEDSRENHSNDRSITGSLAHSFILPTVNGEQRQQSQPHATSPSHRSNESTKIQWPPYVVSDAKPIGTDPRSEHERKEQETNETCLSPQSPSAPKPTSLYPSFIIGGAMAARGEIGFLISSLAQSNGIFDANAASAASSATARSSAIFLIITWAIMLCTVIGPVIVGILIKRVRALETGVTGAASGREKDLLGVWGAD